MYELDNIINDSVFEGLKVEKICNVNASEILLITLEKNTIFPKHASPRNAQLLVLDGSITFFIQNKEYKLYKNQIFNFPKDEEHWVETHEDSKFLIIQ